MKTLCLLGGTGFFGKSFIQAFIEGKLDRWEIGKIYIASRNATQFSKNNYLYLNPNISYVDLDISNISEIPDCDYVMHFANSSQKISYEKNTKKEIDNINKGMLSFVESIINSKNYPSHILYTSSGAVYGPTAETLFSEKFPIKTAQRFKSVKQDYAEAKLISEDIFRQLNNKNIKLSIARCFSFVGPFLPRHTHFVAGNLIQNILNREPLEVKASRPIYRSYLHTDDLITWLMTVLTNGNEDCPTYNVGSDDVVEIHELAKDLSSHFDLPLKITQCYSNIADLYVPNICKCRSLGLNLTYSSIEATLKTIEDINRVSSRYRI